MRGALYSLLSWLIVSIYGGKICPILNGYPLWRFALGILAPYAAMTLARAILEKRIVVSQPPERQAARQFLFDLALFAACSLAVGATAVLGFGSPLENGIKVCTSSLLLGLFFALELSLHRERTVVLDFQEQRLLLTPPSRYFPLTTKFALIAGTGVLLAAAVLSGVVSRDIYLFFLTPEANADWGVSIHAVMLDVFYVMGVLLALGMLCLVSYAQNLKLYFNRQTRALELVAKGDLEASVPVVSHDEFGVIAAHTNQMIDGLKERKKIKEIFGKLVSPTIAARLLGQDGNHPLEGERLEAVVLFADLRGFTAMSENLPPETVVATLNAFFTGMVEAIHGHGGLVDKFIGDAVMAVFGLAGEANAAGRAMEAALDMLANAQAQGLAMGIGIHKGPLVAGNIGSPERLEFTVIGDTVNAASRIQDITKDLKTPLVVSRRVYDTLPDALAARLIGFGPQVLRGRTGEMELWGLEGAA